MPAMLHRLSGPFGTGHGRSVRPPARVRLPALVLAIGVCLAGGHLACGFALWRLPAAGEGTAAAQPRRLAVLGGLGVAASAPALPALAYETYKDLPNGYSFTYPSGLQKSENKAYTVFLRDVIEPLESVGVKVTPTTRKSLDEIGDAMEVAKRILADNVPSKAPQEIIKAESKLDRNGRRIDVIEYAYQWKFDDDMAQKMGRQRFQLHNKALVSIDKRKQYFVLASAEEPRWPVQGDQLGLAVDTFKFTTE
mmetsp:Transcript_50344/g.146045  ORF Transcript_50344/g.146045 Transcript_50344/m.146045 type:complete len:251 (+) Transcript_50344:68-820(+)